MERNETLEAEHRILGHLCCIPRRILSMHYMDNMTEFVLHDLCDKHCFNFRKAAYFIDNPDFNCFKGVAGFLQGECSVSGQSIWDDPFSFSRHMKSSAFNQKVRRWWRCSIKNDKEADEVLIAMIADELELKNHKYCSWDIRHDNHGLLVYEQSESELDSHISEFHLLNGVCLLGLCPVV